jgi:hypothetical protein
VLRDRDAVNDADRDREGDLVLENDRDGDLDDDCDRDAVTDADRERDGVREGVRERDGGAGRQNSSKLRVASLVASLKETYLTSSPALTFRKRSPTFKRLTSSELLAQPRRMR